MRLRPLSLLTSLMLLLAGAGTARSQEPAALLKAIAGVAPRYRPGRDAEERQARRRPRPAHLEDGVLVPADRRRCEPTELVFLGKGRIEVEPPDAIEAGQLELFTGAPRLDEELQGGRPRGRPDAAVTALLRKPAAQLDAGDPPGGPAPLGEWRKKREWEIFDVDGGILLDALQDPVSAGLLRRLVPGRRPGGLPLLRRARRAGAGDSSAASSPSTPRRRRSARSRRQISREQRKGRLLGAWRWMIWGSGTPGSRLAAARLFGGKPAPGTPAFEPKKYTLERT